MAGDTPSPHPCASLLRGLLFIILISVVVVAAFGFYSYFFYRPNSPIVNADSLSLSSFNLTTPPFYLLTGIWHLRLTVENPNDDTYLDYDRIEASVYYMSQPLSNTTLAPFVQPMKNQTLASARFAVARAYVDRTAGEGMTKDWREEGSVEFNVRMMARVRYKPVYYWWARPRFLRVYCEGLQVKFSENSGSGSMLGGTRRCKARL